MGAAKPAESTKPTAASDKSDAFDLDVILQHMGVLGKFQLKFLLLNCYAAIFPAAVILVYNFTGYLPQYRCFVPGCDNEELPMFNESWVNETMHYYTKPTGQRALDRCTRYITSNITETDQCPVMSNETIKCDRWIFDKSLFSSTVVTEFELTCENEWKQTLIGSLTMAGLLVGAFTLGPLADIWGRRKAYLFLSIWFSGFAIASSFAPTMDSYAALRFFTGVGGIALLQTNYIWGVEIMAKHLRVKFGFILQLCAVMGNIIVGGISYGIRDWRIVQLILFVPMTLMILYFLILPESPRWLIIKKRYDEAREILQRGAKLNGKEIPAHLLVTPLEEEIPENAAAVPQQSESIFAFCKSWILVKRLLVLFLGWISAIMSYYGLSMASSNLSGDIFLNYELTIIVEIPAYLVGMFILDIIGRRATLNATLILGGLSCLVAGLVPADMTGVIIGFSLLGKFFISMEMVTVTTLTSEVFPTASRGATIGLCSTMGKVGGILAPIIASIGKTNRPIPYLIFGITNVAVGVLSLVLPETKGTTLPSNVAEAEDLEKYTLSILRCRKQKDEKSTTL